ncbi:MAG: patatin-like phospholipase family protein, partial [Saprospiraceae bacterium]|nr:patatin-like phospholipase family protein [Saprospiraceae bacterium]
MKALVISGGGAKGAWAGGFVEFLSKEAGMNWDILIGSSTGSLLVPLIAVNAFEDLKKAYTTSHQRDIFSNCPFFLHKTEEGFKASFNHFRILLQFMQGRKTFGESRNLKHLISRAFPEKTWEALQASGKQVIATVSNLTHNQVEYKYARDCTYEDFCDWIWMSCNLVPFMSLAIKDGCEYADAGFGNPIPIQEAISLGATEIDAIVLQPRHKVSTSPPASNAFMLMLKTFNFMQNQLAHDDIQMGLSESRLSGNRTRLIHTPVELT